MKNTTRTSSMRRSHRRARCTNGRRGVVGHGRSSGLLTKIKQKLSLAAEHPSDRLYSSVRSHRGLHHGKGCAAAGSPVSPAAAAAQRRRPAPRAGPHQPSASPGMRWCGRLVLLTGSAPEVARRRAHNRRVSRRERHARLRCLLRPSCCASRDVQNR